MKGPATAQLVLGDPAYAGLKAHVIEVTGLAYYADKDADLAERIGRRLEHLGLPDCGAYRALLDSAPGAAERDALIEELTIGETFFFRHRELFDALRDIAVPERLAARHASRRLRILSAGCATGAEAYSLSILLRRDLAAQTAGWDIRIIGTDINRRFLARARAAEFDDWALRSTPPAVKQACFERRGQSWVVRPAYRAGVSFQYHNLVVDRLPSQLNNLCAFDVILCRNVMIYFSRAIVARLVAALEQSLVEGGWLLVGPAEPNLEVFQAFRTVNAPGAVLYQRAEWPRESPGTAVPGLPPRQRQAPESPGTAVPGLPRLRREAPESPGTAVPGLSPPQPASFDIDSIRTLVEREPLNAVAHYYHGLLLEQQGRTRLAVAALRRCLYLERGFVLAHYCLGLMLHKLGEPQAAGRSFRNVVELLERLEPQQVCADGDGITAAELRKLAEMQLGLTEAT